MLQYSPKIVTDSLVMCLDASNNKSYPAADLPVKNGLVMWMDAADDTTFSYSSGTTVSQWRDKSGFNYHMVPKSSGPTRNAFLNSRKVLAFTTLQTIGNNTINLASSANTVFVVSRLTGTTNNRVLTCNLGSGGNNWLLGHHGATVNDYYAEGWVYDSATAADTAWRMFMGDWSGSSTNLANLYSNGTAITTNSTAANQGPNKLGINYFSGEVSTNEVAEIIVFDRVLSTVERRLVHTYLGQKWGISNTDRSIVDLARNDDNGLLGNGTVANMPDYDYYEKGTLRFNGSSDFFPVTRTLSVPLTISGFIKYIDSSKVLNTFMNGQPHTTLAISLNRNGSGNLQVFIGNGSAWLGTPSINSSSTISANTWYHITFTCDGTISTLYLNGVSVGTSANIPSGFGSYFYFGHLTDNASSSEYLKGNIANVQLYTKSLSAVEVLQNYEAQKSKFANTIVQQGLVLNLDAGNPYSYAGAGSVWYDVSGNNYTGTLTNGPTFNGLNGGSIVFDGTDDNVQLGNASNFISADAITVNCWVKTNVTEVYKKIFVTVTAGTRSITGVYFSLGPSPYNYYFGINGVQQATSTSNLSTTQYNNICGTYDKSNIKLYLNGVLLATTAYTTSISTSGIGRISGYDNGGEIWNGNISSVMIYNRALTATEVLQNYNATKGRFGL